MTLDEKFAELVALFSEDELHTRCSAYIESVRQVKHTEVAALLAQAVAMLKAYPSGDDLEDEVGLHDTEYGLTIVAVLERADKIATAYDIPFFLDYVDGYSVEDLRYTIHDLMRPGAWESSNC
jgi:2-methylisocitrate lyase-like PEP mutase family enzyme